MTLEKFDDTHQRHELVYAITKDEVNRRITLVFRGTESKLAFRTNWSTNIHVSKVEGIIPPTLKQLNPHLKSIKFHSGFYNYVFAKTHDQSDDSHVHKYDEILNDLKDLFKKHPGFKLYVTGHSLGGALSTLVAFYLSCEPHEDIPKPVMNISYASPRLADSNTLEATRLLEESNKLRILRIV